MNQYRVTFTLETYSDAPEEWLTDVIVDNLEEDERVTTMEVQSIKPMYIGRTKFESKDDAMDYCRFNQLSPTVIHHAPN